MKSGAKFNISRRKFLSLSIFIAVGSRFLSSCKSAGNKLFLKLTGTHHVLGHRLRFPDFPKPSKTLKTPILILGGGVSGLSAAYQLTNGGLHDFLLIDMEKKVGGNAKSDQNEFSKYPLGAHYLPVPNRSNTALIRFLEECEIIIGRDAKDNPIFDPEQLSFAPQVRLFLRNTWQEGLIPRYGLEEAETEEFSRFLKQMTNFQSQKGKDNKFVFDIPLAHASQQHELTSLDQYTMHDWMLKEGYRGEYLFNYVNYCCRDDYGLGAKHISAFAGIHYFAARKHDLIDDYDNVLTWQEGNARLTSHLTAKSKGKVLTEQLAYKISIEDDRVEVLVYDEISNSSSLITADFVISCCPQFVNQYLIPERSKLTKDFTYVPWVVATLVLNKFPFADGVPLAWDNVIHGAKGLGYVYAQQQSLAQFSSPFVISYYHSMDDGDVKKSRAQLFEWTDEQWKQFILNDLSIAHYGIAEEVQSMEIYRHGHGMICPVPGFLNSSSKQHLAEPIEEKIFFAHSDLSGISIFEEAFYQGINVADKVLAKQVFKG
ncbi:FAD-dependent oxidoreductase [Sphingobacterium bambusae]|uniref:FAD-dependent oxidoreductase n=1 Tax=Sphingobacterium bambusae TaxID=662858 RepID=A0ABW6BL39_9SPHI|nr:FAD-dependent oxidoreductase [Sphingobacterium bambusae]WPL50995.1 FAD-dependent oxidoreductase [Sphingobacterium bambusae]